MLFPVALRHGIPGNGILQSSKLGVRIVAEGGRGPSAEKEAAVFHQLSPCLSQDQVLVRVQAQDLYGIGIAVKKEPDQLHKGIDHRIGGPVLELLKVSQADQVGGKVQGCSPQVYIAPLPVRAVAVAAG